MEFKPEKKRGEINQTPSFLNSLLRAKRQQEKTMRDQSIKFKWNPFLLRGEAPASLRFLEGDLEFASKEDLEAIKADPKLQKVHAAMLAGVNKKFQEFAAEKKKLEETVTTMKGQIEELDGGLSEWETWFTQNKPLLEKASKIGKTGNGNDQRGKNRSQDDSGDDDEKLNRLMATVNEAGEKWVSQVNKKVGHLNRMLGFSMELNDLMRLHPKMDAQKVLDLAIKNQHRTLTDAYKDAYGEEIINEQVEERVKTRVDEEVKKRTPKLETGSGSLPFSLELPKELPKSFTDAGKQFLEERAAEEAKGGSSDHSQDKGGKA